MKRTIVVGDVHGCLEELLDLKEAVGYRPREDRLILLGDLMDRGPHPVALVKYLQAIQDAGCDVQAVLGNHDEKHIRWRKHENNRAKTGKKNPMTSMNDLRQQQNAMMDETDIAWLKNLPRKLVLTEYEDTWVLVHGGMHPGIPVSEQNDDEIIRIRGIDVNNDPVSFSMTHEPAPGEVFWATRWTGPESILYGHAVYSLNKPRVDEFPGGVCIGLDTGCCFGGHLTAFILPSKEFVQVKAIETYIEWRGPKLAP